jgi:hypothetical protein
MRFNNIIESYYTIILSNNDVFTILLLLLLLLLLAPCDAHALRFSTLFTGMLRNNSADYLESPQVALPLFTYLTGMSRNTLAHYLTSPEVAGETSQLTASLHACGL